MKTLGTVIVGVIAALILVLGIGGFITKASATRQVGREQIHRATPDDIILQEVAIELRKAAENNAEARVELEDLRYEHEHRAKQAADLESELQMHRQNIAQERAMLETNQQEFHLNGQQVSRQRIEKDVIERIKVCKSLETEILSSQEISAAYQQTSEQFNAQIAKASDEYQTALAEYDRLKADLWTSRVIEGLNTRLNNFSGVGESSNLAQLTGEVRKRIARSRATSESITPIRGSGLLDLSSAPGSSAKAAADAYLGDIIEPNTVRSIPEPAAPSTGLLHID